MGKLRLVLLSALALLGIAAATASSASAAFELTATKCENTGKVSFCYETKEKGTELKELKGEETVEAKQIGKGLLLTTFNKTSEVHIECTETKLKGGLAIQLEPLVKATTLSAEAIVFGGCKVVTPKNCTIAATQTTTAIVAEAVNNAVVKEGVLVKPATGTVFIEIQFLGEECLVKGKQPIGGSQICLWSPEAAAEEDLAGGHELKCEHSESKLFFASTKEPASLEATVLVTLPTLESGKDFWDVTLS
jgi:hypothetical protein